MPAIDVGIHAIEVYFPRFYVKQSDLELADDCVGKYTNGLGQEKLGICSIEEDINSIALTVVSQLVRRIDLDLKTVGFLEVGSETLIDKSKSTKSVLMKLFESSGNLDVEGVDVKNACFGGTAALFHAINWLESSSWDGRWALVVAADIAVYGTKAARPTGGAGAVAILLGPNAPLIFDQGLRAHTVRHRYDFYKPDLSSEYPVVDGQLSMRCYQEALLHCYTTYKQKALTKGFSHVGVASHINRTDRAMIGGLPIDYLCFHSPFTRLVRKAYGWLALADVQYFMQSHALNGCILPCGEMGGVVNSTHVLDQNDKDITTGLKNVIDAKVLERLTGLNGSESPKDRDTICMEATADLYAQKVEPGLIFAKQIGNMYTASLYGCLASLLLSVPESKLRQRRVLLYSYGSGFASSMFSLRVHPSRPLTNIVHSSPVDNVDDDPKSNPVFHRLFHNRTELTVAQFEELLAERKSFHNAVSFRPVHRPEGLFPGSYYLTEVDERYQRNYCQLPIQ